MVLSTESKHLAASVSGDKWRKIGLKRRAGVLAPLFSLYSSKSAGIGDINDLRLLVDWCVLTGNGILQMLPMNELGPVFCPYDSMSSFALEPLYFSFSGIASDTAAGRRVEALKKKFPLTVPRVDYKLKWDKLSLLWEMFLEEEKAVKADASFLSFRERNTYWLKDFSCFKVIKYYAQGKAWYEWDDVYRRRDKEALLAFENEHSQELLFQEWLQWKLFEQMTALKDYAADKGVLLKGDLPILVSRDSADVWAHPEFFKLHSAAGAPPDMYCSKGQRWGMPTYEWGKIAADGYTYFKEKLRYAQNFYDLLRVDHVVGLFRIWSIPYDDPLENQGLHGSFDPAEENCWREHGRKILSVMLDNTGMLLCAEDLGVIPWVCTEALREYGIPGNDVQRWAKDWDVRHDFLPPEEQRFSAVSMLSTHDTTNFAAWWENEAGTVDEGLFMRKCYERGIDYGYIKGLLFDAELSKHGRLRWLDTLSDPGTLASILGRRGEDVGDILKLHADSYGEKNKFWEQIGLRGRPAEKADTGLGKLALALNLRSQAIFCVQTLLDWFYPAGIFQGDPYAYRLNTPGTVGPENWSLRMPMPLEKLLKNEFNAVIKEMVAESGRE
ncbi:MAG: 4-alpha-glucanotransferase [Candidatus Omnitrophota bacterium]|jgi:4-alpha-glucanotransferase